MNLLKELQSLNSSTEHLRCLAAFEMRNREEFLLEEEPILAAPVRF